MDGVFLNNHEEYGTNACMVTAQDKAKKCRALEIKKLDGEIVFHNT